MQYYEILLSYCVAAAAGDVYYYDALSYVVIL
jgi:hypothetical protein